MIKSLDFNGKEGGFSELVHYNPYINQEKWPSALLAVKYGVFEDHIFTDNLCLIHAQLVIIKVLPAGV